MKNKKKLANRQNDNLKKVTPQVPGEWFYMSTEAITVETLREALEDIPAIDMEIWKEMGVLEASVPEKGGLDFSQLELDLGDAFSNQYLEEHEVKTLFGVSFKPENYDIVREMMLHIKGKIGGFFCGDTDDFTPVI